MDLRAIADRGRLDDLNTREISSRLFWGVLATVVVLHNATLYGYASFNLYRAWEHAVDEAAERTRTVAAAVDQSIATHVEKIDNALQTIVNDIEGRLGDGRAVSVEALGILLRQQAQMLPEASFLHNLTHTTG